MAEGEGADLKLILRLQELTEEGRGVGLTLVGEVDSRAAEHGQGIMWWQ